jgi:hypothetical protein
MGEDAAKAIAAGGHDSVQAAYDLTLQSWANTSRASNNFSHYRSASCPQADLVNMGVGGPGVQFPVTATAESDAAIFKDIVTVTSSAHEAKGIRPTMEDRHCTMDSFENQCLRAVGIPLQAFYAVFDGHNGREAADFVCENLYQILEQHLNRWSLLIAQSIDSTVW